MAPCGQCKHIDYNSKNRRYMDQLFRCKLNKTWVKAEEDHPCFEALAGVTKEVIKEVPVEKIVEKIIEKEIIKEIPVEVIKEVIVEKIVYKEKEPEEVYICPICQFIAKSKSGLGTHFRAKHPAEETE